MTDLDKLIAAVEAGDLPEAVFHGSSSIRGHWAYTTGLDVEQRRWVFLAYNGSLDAALRLHEALLPGWEYALYGPNDSYHLHQAQLETPAMRAALDIGFSPISGEAESPARAWLLAILRAIKAKGGS